MDSGVKLALSSSIKKYSLLFDIAAVKSAVAVWCKCDVSMINFAKGKG